MTDDNDDWILILMMLAMIAIVITAMCVKLGVI